MQHEPRRPVEIEPAEDSRGVRLTGYRRDRFRQRVSQLFYEDRIEPVTPAELTAAQAHGGHDALEAAGTATDGHTLVGAGPAVGGGEHLVRPDAETGPDVRNR